MSSLILSNSLQPQISETNNLYYLAEVATLQSDIAIKMAHVTSSLQPQHLGPSVSNVAPKRVFSIIDMNAPSKRVKQFQSQSFVVSMDGQVRVVNRCSDKQPRVKTSPDGTTVTYFEVDGQCQGPAKIQKVDGTRIYFCFDKNKIVPPALKIRPDGTRESWTG